MNRQKLMITNVKFNNRIIWENPAVVYDRMIDNIETKLVASDLKESKEILAKIMERK